MLCAAVTLAVVNPVAPWRMRFASRRATDLPARFKSSAAVIPAMPPPTIATSTSSRSERGEYDVPGVDSIHSERGSRTTLQAPFVCSLMRNRREAVRNVEHRSGFAGEPFPVPPRSTLRGEIERGLRFLHRLELLAPDQAQCGEDPEARDHGAGEEGGREAVDQRSRSRRARGQGGVGPRARDRRESRDSERAADLLRRVDQARGEPRLRGLDTGQSRDRDRNEGEADAKPDQEEPEQQISDVRAADRDLREASPCPPRARASRRCA